MDDNILSLLIYLAILVIGGLASAYRKKKNREAQNKGPVNNPQSIPEKPYKKPFDPFEEIFREFEERPIIVKKEEPENVPETGVLSEESLSSYETEITSQEEIKTLEEKDAEGIYSEEGTPALLETWRSISDSSFSGIQNELASSQIAENQVEIQSIEEEKEPFKFDVKTAIIYSEILKKQHF